jgi:hypothetical protein
MAKQTRTTRTLGPALETPPTTRFSPFKEIGVAGFAVHGGRIATRETNSLVSGTQRWVTYGEMVANTSIVAASVRYFLNIVAHAKWTVAPATDKGAGKAEAEFIDSVLNGMNTPWRRIARRAAQYRFMGFGVQEWIAKRRDEDEKIGLVDIEARPQHTVDRWAIDDGGSVLGVWQVSPQTGQSIYLPRNKIMYMVDDTLTDNPEGVGLYRHLVEPYLRLKKYLLLEGQGFERDLRGIPVGRVPYQALKAAMKAGKITETEYSRIVSAIENFVKLQSRAEDTSIVIDSAPYVVENDGGKSISGTPQYGLELLQGQASDFSALHQAIDRLNREMARVTSTEHLLLGGDSGNRALSEDKSRNFYLICNGTLDDIVDAANKDIIAPLCDLNGIPEDLRPQLTHSDVSFRSVEEITGALGKMAAAGAVLAPDDPAINEVRQMLGLSEAAEMSPEMLGMLTGAKPTEEQGAPDKEDPRGDETTDEDPTEED